MNTLMRSFATLVFLSITPSVTLAEPIQIGSGSFGIGRGVLGTDAGSADLVWLNPPGGAFETATRWDLYLVAALWEPWDGYSSTLLGSRAPVQPLHPGPVPVGGVFSSNSGASFLFVGRSPDGGVPYLAQSIHLQFTGGSFDVPAMFPLLDEEGLYLLRQPFTMTGSWTVFENGATLFSSGLIGRGEAVLVLRADHDTGNSLVSQVIYQFEEPAPVPEPATLILLWLGGAGLAVQRRITRLRRH